MNCNIDRKRTMETASNNTWESKTATKRALPTPTPKFTVTYSRLCDGGAQEMTTAVTSVREIFPDASIATHRRTPEEDVRLGTQNPEVIISSNGEILWSSKQKNLYQKYPKKRKKSIKEIKKALSALKANTASSTTVVSPALPIAMTNGSSHATPETITTTVANEVSEDFSTADVPPASSLEDSVEEEEGFCCAYPLR